MARGKVLQRAATLDDTHVKQRLSINRNDQQIMEKPGAGILSKVQGPKITIEHPVTERPRTFKLLPDKFQCKAIRAWSIPMDVAGTGLMQAVMEIG